MSARPLPMTVAAVLLALFSLLNVIFPLLPTEGVPAFVVYLGVALGVVGLLAAVGLSMLKRWAMWPTIIVSVLNSWRRLRGSPRPRAPCCRCLQRLEWWAPR